MVPQQTGVTWGTQTNEDEQRVNGPTNEQLNKQTKQPNKQGIKTKHDQKDRVSL